MKASLNIAVIVFLVFFTSHGHASDSFIDEQVTPVLDRATDGVSVYLWAAGAASVLLVQNYDQQIQEDWGSHQIMPYSQSQLGDRYVSYGGNIAIALLQLWLDRENGYNHARGLIYTTIVTQGLKVSVQQERPDKSDRYAFPSGHTSSAFATATSLSYAYGWKAGVPAFAMAAFTGLSRIADNKHWASNIVAGGFLGVIWGRSSFFEKNLASEKHVSVLYPSYEDGFFSMNYSLKF